MPSRDSPKLARARPGVVKGSDYGFVVTASKTGQQAVLLKATTAGSIRPGFTAEHPRCRGSGGGCQEPPLDHAGVPEGHLCFQASPRLGAQRVVHDRPRMSLDRP